MSIPPEFDLSRDEIVYLINQFIFSRRDRDSLGRYTSDGYSRHSIVDQLEDLSEQTNDERVKSELRKMISKMEK